MVAQAAAAAAEAPVQFEGEWSIIEREAIPEGTVHEFATDVDGNLKFLLWIKDDQTKLYLTSTSDVAVPLDKPIFWHARTDWFRPPKSTRLLANSDETKIHVFDVANDLTRVFWPL